VNRCKSLVTSLSASYVRRMHFSLPGKTSQSLGGRDLTTEKADELKRNEMVQMR